MIPTFFARISPLLVVAFVTACSYNPKPENHTQRCGSATQGQQCPSGYACRSDGYCWIDGTSPSDGGAVGGTSASAGRGGAGGTRTGGAGGAPSGGTGGLGGGGGGRASGGAASGGTSTGGTGTGGAVTGGAGVAGNGTGGATGGTTTGGNGNGGARTGGAGPGGTATGGRATGGMATGGMGTGGAPAECQTNQTKCSGTDLQTCGSNGMWTAAQSCGTRRSCTGPAGTAKCTCVADSVCTSVATGCSNATTMVSCSQDANGCFYQTSPTACTNGACSGGVCCTNQCPPGTGTCENGGTKTCEKGANGCTAWKTTSCTSPLVCERYSGPVCADPNWAQWPMPTSPEDTGAPNPPSYKSNGDGTVTDNVTGLIWQATSSNGNPTFADAKSYCTSQSTGGYFDWRVPAEIELISLIQYASGGIHPAFDLPSPGLYWSSTSVGTADSGWGVNFGGGHPFQSPKSENYSVRCVR